MSDEYLDEFTDLEGFFNTAWASVNPTVRIARDNVDFVPSTNDNAWVRFGVFPVQEAQVELVGDGSNRLYRNHGNIAVQIFVPLNAGQGLARKLASDAANIFRGKQISNILTRAPRVVALGRAVEAEGANDARWYQMNVTIPYQRDSFL